MSDHHYTDVTDPDANLIPFKQQLHSVVARARNARLGRFDSVWSGDAPYDTGRSSDDESLMDLVSTLTNSVKAGLVKDNRVTAGSHESSRCRVLVRRG
ncbi:hypothetical protein ENSA5_54120 [Enhygromyxa salina]|uniref:Uncharacterized protein n=1 Tax=Enhygromyxa salina TaxID=215803 RepID=A0A2S9XFV4_9BACT|nr:hypothetical protein [Enhygromyxa salina]PRP91561.1 hypothetical protein ENSA5_54120 [Enhygromyxa salina]